MSGSGGDADLASLHVATLHLSVRPADALFVPVFMPKKDQEVFVGVSVTGIKLIWMQSTAERAERERVARRGYMGL